MKLRHKVLLLLAIGIVLLSVAMPVSAALDVVTQGDWIFIGEKGLDVSDAVDSTNYTQIAWWDTTSDPLVNPADMVINVGDEENFDVDSRFYDEEFGWGTGYWYRFSGSGFSNDTAFYVSQPQGYIRINDLAFTPPANDVTDGSAFLGDLIDFKIYSDLRLILTERGGGSGLNFRLNIRNPDGVSFSSLYTLSGAKSLTDLGVNDYPWFWSSGISSSSDPFKTWKTNETDSFGYAYYDPGTYTVWFTCNANDLNYKSPDYTITLEEEKPILSVNPSSLIRGNKFTTSIEGLPNTAYIVWIKDCAACPNGCCSDPMTGICCDQPPLILPGQEGVSFYDEYKVNFTGPCPYEGPCPCDQYDTCDGIHCPPCLCNNGQVQKEPWTINDTLIQWCGCQCTKTVRGIMPEDDEVAKYTYAIVKTDEYGVRNFSWQTSTCTAPTSYKIHTQRWIPEDVCRLDPERPYAEVCVNVEQGDVTIQTDVCDEPTDTSYLGETVHISGTNTDSPYTYLFFKGPCQSCSGENMTATNAVVTGNSTTFTKVKVKPDGTWEYPWYTRNLQIDLGQYTIYASSMPNDAPSLEGVPCNECEGVGVSCAAWAKASFTFLEPTLIADVHPKIIQIICCAGPDIMVDGEALGLRGEAVGQEYNTVPIGIWVFGENKVAGHKYIFEPVEVECSTGEFSVNLKSYFDTLDLVPGTYTVVVQHPMYNHRLDIIPEEKICDQSEWCPWLRFDSYVLLDEVWYPDTNRKFVVTATPVRWSKLFVIDGPDRLAGTAALNALVAGFNDPNIDDQIKILTFKVESNNALQAGFSGTPTSGGAPLSVFFTDISLGFPTAWHWDFGDGYTSDEQNPTHVYENVGTYDVTLTVTGLSGSSSITKNDYVTVTTGPTQTGTVTPTPTTPTPSTMNLYSGWNFISTPRALADGQNTASSVFSGVNTGGHSIFTYDAGSTSWQALTANSTVKPLDGIWIYSTAPVSVSLTYKNDPLATPPTKAVYTGWNSIGFSDVNPAAAKDTLQSVQSQWTQLIGYNGASQYYETSIIKGGSGSHSDTNPMNPFKGYWLFMNAPGTLAAISA